MDALTLRAEPALLGAMITDPDLARRLRISPQEFIGQRHAVVYASIRAAGQARFAGVEGWRALVYRRSDRFV